MLLKIWGFSLLRSFSSRLLELCINAVTDGSNAAVSDATLTVAAGAVAEGLRSEEGELCVTLADVMRLRVVLNIAVDLWPSQSRVTSQRGSSRGTGADADVRPLQLPHTRSV